MFTSYDQMAAALVAADIAASDARQIAMRARPCVGLATQTVVDESDIPLGVTKIGGLPDLPRGTNWPVRPAYSDAARRAAVYWTVTKRPDGYWPEATREQCNAIRRDNAEMSAVVQKPFPLAFIAQIDFAEMWLAGPLESDFPKSGRLSIFYDVFEQPWGFAPADQAGTAVLFHAPDARELVRRNPPSAFAVLDRYFPFAPLACSKQHFLAPLPIETAEFESLHLAKETRDAYQMCDTEEVGAWLWHCVGGWPTPIQGDMQTECALVAAGYDGGNPDTYRAPEMAGVRATATEWLLLAQIGCDEEAGMMWGDLGRLYVWMRRQDLAARRFGAARIILQCS